MKKTLQILLTTLCIFTVSQFSTAQTTVTVNGSSTWVGYASVFEINGTVPLFGDFWGVPALKSTITASNNTVVLQPNFNCYADATTAEAIAYWRNGAEGNKIFEGNTFVESTTIDGQIVNFTGNVTSNTLASGYTAVAFIKGLNPATGYSTDFIVTTPLTPGVFNLSSVTAIPDGLIVQYGFTIKGLNGNPANETALGNVTVTAAGATNPSTVNVTLKVDMSQQTGFTTPHVAGLFNGWSDTANPMTDANADGIWEATIALAPGNHEYKFLKDSWTAGSEQLAAGTSCTLTTSGYTNRIVTVGNTDMTVPTVCWASCAACNVQNATVTFKVDMSQQTGFTTANINGTFNGWCGACNPMTDANSDGIWEITLPLPAASYEYKFTFDGWTGQENLTAGSSCTVTANGYTNRTVTVGTTNITQDTVCWGYCVACNLNNDSFDSNTLKIYPNPASNAITIENESTIESVNIYNVVGQEVKVASPNANSITLDISNLETGIYIIKSVSEGKTNTTKFVKK